MMILAVFGIAILVLGTICFAKAIHDDNWRKLKSELGPINEWLSKHDMKLILQWNSRELFDCDSAVIGCNQYPDNPKMVKFPEIYKKLRKLRKSELCGNDIRPGLKALSDQALQKEKTFWED